MDAIIIKGGNISSIPLMRFQDRSNFGMMVEQELPKYMGGKLHVGNVVTVFLSLSINASGPTFEYHEISHLLNSLEDHSVSSVSGGGSPSGFS